MHQQRSGLVPVAFALSMAQILGSWQIGQRVGSMVFMNTFKLEKVTPGMLLSACSIKVFGGGASRIRTADLWIMIKVYIKKT